MPFDPTQPANHSALVSAEMRGQLNGLKDLIDALQSINAAQVDAVTTGNPGDPASVALTVDGTTLRFSFAIPRGQDGFSAPPITSFLVDGVTTLNPGENATVATSFDGANVRLLFGIPRGDNGTPGGNGSDGGQGPPFTNFVIDGVTTLDPTQPATVQANFDGTAVRLLFSIPRGNDGNTGGDGAPGIQGPPGEVTNAQLTAAITGTSSNSNAVAVLGMTVSDPPTQGEMQQIANKMDELIVMLRR